MDNVTDLLPGQFVDLFGDQTQNQEPQRQGFGTDPNQANIDLFSTTTTTIAPTTTDTTTIDPNGDLTTTTTTIIDLFKEDPNKAATPDTTIFKDMATYMSDRIKNGKFVELVEEDTEGNSTPFVPKTPEDFDKVFDLQVDHLLEKRKKEVEEGWYQTKSPAWKAVAQYAEMTDDPTEVIPFLQGMRNIESIKDVDPKEIEGAELIVRTALEQRGDTQEMIDEMVETLKTTAKLIPSAEKYKPALLQQETARLQQMIYTKQQEEKQYNILLNDIRENSIKSIEAPIFGKQKLKGEEKQAIFKLISEPDRETGGFLIYDRIDKLYETKDFEKLKKIALLLEKEEALVKYISTIQAEKTASDIQIKIKAANENKTSSGNTNLEADKIVVKKPVYGPPTFGKAR